MLSLVEKPALEFKPAKISRCESIELNGRIENVFPLFGPVKEKEWAAGWNPEIIYSETYLVEEHMVFKTKSFYMPEDHYTWVISKYDPEKKEIEYTVSTPNRIWFIHVQCKSVAARTMASISYTYIGLTKEGDVLNRDALEKMYQHNLKDWEKAINYYLETGKMIAH